MVKMPNGELKPAGHAVTAHGYHCPGGDVRTLRLLYQENAVGAPYNDKAGRFLMDPDAIKFYFWPDNLEDISVRIL